MDALIKLFSSLRVYWKIIIITLICNALIIYLICFLIIPEFKNYPLSNFDYIINWRDIMLFCFVLFLINCIINFLVSCSSLNRL